MSSKDKQARRVALRQFLVETPGALDRAAASLGWLVALGAVALGALVLHLVFGRPHHPPVQPPGDDPTGALYVRDLGRLADGRHTFDLVYEQVLRNQTGEQRALKIRDQLTIGDVTGTGDVIELGHAPGLFADPATRTSFGVTWHVALSGPAGPDELTSLTSGQRRAHAAHFRINAWPAQLADVATFVDLDSAPDGWFEKHGRHNGYLHDEEVQLGAVLRAHCALGVKIQDGEMRSLCGS